MDKIIKIHIARVPYSIEAKADTELNKYLEAIRSNLDVDTAEDVIQDVESRIPELLAERKIKQDDVITRDDVLAIKEQLGEPEQFSNDQSADEPGTRAKKLFRDSDAAILGGVASGIGQYLNVDANLVRVAFLLLTFLSGFGVVLYLFLWLLLPEAKTSADKLMMSGEPVTVAALQHYRTSVQRGLGSGPRMLRKLIKRTLQIAFVSLATIAGVSLLSVLGLFTDFLYINPFHPIFSSYDVDYFLLGLLWAAGLSIIGLLVILSLRVWSHRSVRLKIGGLIFAVTFLVAAVGMSASGLLVYNHFSNQYGNGKDNRSLAVDDVTPTAAPTALNIKSDSNLNLTYVVTSQPLHATYAALPGLAHPNLTITSDNGTVTVDSSQLDHAAPSCLGDLCKHIYLPVRVTLYGPALRSISDINGATLSINNANLGNSLSLRGSNGSMVNLDSSYVNSLTISAVNGARVLADNTSTQTAAISVDLSSLVDAPATNNLTANLPLPMDCDQNGDQVLNLGAYSGRVVINGRLQTMNDVSQNSCINSDEF